MMTHILPTHTTADARASIQYHPLTPPRPSTMIGINGLSNIARMPRISRPANKKKSGTAALHRMLLTILLCLVGWGEVWGQNAEISGNAWNNISNNTISWSGSHAQFKLSGGSMSYGSTLGGYIDISKNTNYTLGWTINPSCTINVTSVYVKAGSAQPNCTFYLGTKSVGCGWSNKELTDVPSTNGNTGNIIMKASNFIYTIQNHNSYRNIGCGRLL